MRDYLFKKWYGFTKRFYTQDTALQRKRTVAEGLVETFMVGSNVGATAYIVFTSFKNALSLTIGDIMMYSQAFSGGLSNLQIAFDEIAGIYVDALFLNDLLEFNKINPKNEARIGKKKLVSPIRMVEFINVSFKYPNCQSFALKNINLKLECSKNTLILGENGAGKTTLIKLLARLYEPTHGCIKINGIDIRDIEVEELRKHVGIMFQDYARYAFTVYENIGCGAIEDINNKKRVQMAAKRACADVVIQGLFDLYDTKLGRMFSGGCELSVGQWQRICLARLFMKDADIVVFDEPTANVDIETEAKLFSEMKYYSKNKVVIMISHRVYRRDIADQIVVLANGYVKDVGKYDELLLKKGEFYRLWKIYQSRGVNSP